MDDKVYSPDRWAIIEIKNKDGESCARYKILGGWSGGYLDGDSWRLSSRIVSYVSEENLHIVTNDSGSIYHLYRQSEGCNTVMGNILYQLKGSEKVVIEVVDMGEVKLQCLN